MSVWLDNKYINLLSVKLDRFKKVNNNYNFRCPICGDSKKSLIKTRGWILIDGSRSRFYCHNCGASLKLEEFIEKIDPVLFGEYKIEKLIERNSEQTIIEKIKPNNNVDLKIFKNLKKISQLDSKHPAKIYITKRKIPSNHHHYLYYAPKFKKFVNSVVENKFSSIEKDEPRLIIPLIDENNNVIGFQGRAFTNSSIRYITIMFDQSKQKIFGMNNFDKNKKGYVLEGPIDSMFLNNAIAEVGSLSSTSLNNIGLNKENTIIVTDNEPRNIDTVKKIEKIIKSGYKVCIWPVDMKYKDINEMIINGYTIDQIYNIIDKRTFQGLNGELELMEWKRV